MIDPVTSKEETLSPSEIVHETAYLGSMKNARDVLVAGIGTFTSHMAPMKVSTPTRERAPLAAFLERSAMMHCFHSTLLIDVDGD